MRRTICLASSRALCALTPRAAPESSSILLRRIPPPPPPALRHAHTHARPQDDDDGGRRTLAAPRGYTTQRDIERSGRDRPPRDHEITDPLIMVIDNGAVEGPLETAYVLTKLEPDESLRMIQPYFPGDAPRAPGQQQNKEEGGEVQEVQEPRPRAYAVCKIVNKREEYERQRLLKERKRSAAALKPKTKELELTWAISSNDLAVKMGRLGAFLAKGMKVELTIGRKKGGKKVAPEDAADILRAVREELERSGGREGKPAQGPVGGTMKLYLEGVARG